jgi:hypothetical protein
MNTKRELEIEEDLEFQRKEWRAQRVGMVVFVMFVMLALLGLTGMGGPFSRGETGDPAGSVNIEYERFVRRSALSRVTMRVRSAPGPVQFWVSAGYLEHIEIRRVSPEPDRVTVERNRHVYTIQGASPEVTVVFELEHKTAGTLDAEVGLVGGPAVRFRQWSIF